MKKLILLITSLLILLTACGTNGNNTPTPNSADPTGTGTQQNTSTVPQELALCRYEGCMTKDGYYYLKYMETEEGGQQLIIYLDVKSMLEIPLCNKPNCKHTDENCNALVGEGSLITNQKNLILIEDSRDFVRDFRKNGGTVTMTGGAPSFMSSESGPQTIYSINLDGTNRTKLLELESGMRLQTPYVVSGNKLYAVKYETKQNTVDGGDGSFSSSMSQENEELVCIDLEKKTVTVICDFKDKDIIGVYKNRLIIESRYSDVDPSTVDTYNDAEFFKYYNNMDRSIISFDVSTKEEKTYITAKTKNLEFPILEGGIICYMDGKKVKKLDLDSGEISEVSVYLKKLKANISIIADGKLIYSFYEDKQVNAEMEYYYYHDLATGENKEITLKVNSAARAGEKTILPVEILESFGDSYLVTPKYDEEKENTWAGTIQYNLKRKNYALIKKADYWQSKANYTYFEED